jgi:hypothetical protein
MPLLLVDAADSRTWAFASNDFGDGALECCGVVAEEVIGQAFDGVSVRVVENLDICRVTGSASTR